MEILIIEDDPVIGRAVQRGLEEAGHGCQWLKDGTEGLSAAETQKHDVIILDLLVPGEPGLAILEKMRKTGVQTPVLILTALGSVEDRVIGLKKGADDYLTKPFDMAELLARVEALSRRSTIKPSAVLEVGSLVLDLPSRRVTGNGVFIELTPTEFSILELLMRHAGQVVTRKMLCEALWNSDWEGTTNVIEVHINRLRTKLQRATKEPLIHTVRGRGYALRATT
ncbi:MAG: response regulator transcription factor [Planctomycetes bacterium]|nr:response regulator transcription factor [Planctomycetota bacterium]